MAQRVVLNKKGGFVGLTLGNNIDGQTGVVVVKVKPGSLAAKNRMDPGTVVNMINGRRVNTHQEAVRAIDDANDVVLLECGDRANIGRVMASLTRGWVFKLSPRGVWQPRWLSIDVTRDVTSLNYYVEPNAPKTRGIISAESIVGVRKGSAVPVSASFEMVIPEGPSEWRHHGSERSTFEVEVASGRIYTFAAPTGGWASEWITSLTKLRFADKVRFAAGKAPPARLLGAAAAPPRGKTASYLDGIASHVGTKRQPAIPAAA